ncbi:MAG: hypothetical protein LBJ18_00680 [Rickettsiales bacterium]|jgi:hypothetical protein|nr:hypothetical protein [Rickettsiales bacterium]
MAKKIAEKLKAATGAAKKMVDVMNPFGGPNFSRNKKTGHFVMDEKLSASIADRMANGK